MKSPSELARKLLAAIPVRDDVSRPLADQISGDERDPKDPKCYRPPTRIRRMTVRELELPSRFSLPPRDGVLTIWQKETHFSEGQLIGVLGSKRPAPRQ